MDVQMSRRNTSILAIDDLRNIILHIQQDCAEKVEEVQVKAEEEFKHERMREILLGYAKVDEDYRLKVVRSKGEFIVYESKMKNESRLKILEMKYEHVEDVMEKARQRLSNKDEPAQRKPYRNILKALMMQGLCKLIEPMVEVYCRKKDLVLIRSLLAECQKAYTSVSSLGVDLTLGESHFLSDDTEGGLLLATPEISLDNTLSARLAAVGFYLLPYIATKLFGYRTESLMDNEEEDRMSYLPSLSTLEQSIFQDPFHPLHEEEKSNSSRQ